MWECRRSVRTAELKSQVCTYYSEYLLYCAFRLVQWLDTCGEMQMITDSDLDLRIKELTVTSNSSL